MINVVPSFGDTSHTSLTHGISYKNVTVKAESDQIIKKLLFNIKFLNKS